MLVFSGKLGSCVWYSKVSIESKTDFELMNIVLHSQITTLFNNPLDKSSVG